MAGEFDLIAKIRQSLGNQPRNLVDLGIGDDCAVIRQPDNGQRLLVTTDMLLEGRHFVLNDAPEMARLIGRKAMAVNISDIAAMAGTPVAAFISVALPRGSAESTAREITIGLMEEAARFETCLAGGDTNIWDGPLVINVTLLGYEPVGGAVLRSGARPGDCICISGPLGGSFASGRHLRPEPRVETAQRLKMQLGAQLHAMIDLSDGLAGDLRHILKESGGLGAVLHADRIPVHADLLQFSPETEFDLNSRIAHALGDGEDFELCFCVDPQAVAQLPAGISVVGEITENPGMQMMWPDGSVSEWTSGGFDHGTY